MDENEIQENNTENVQGDTNAIPGSLSDSENHIVDVPEETSGEISEDAAEVTSAPSSEDLPAETSCETSEELPEETSEEVPEETSGTTIETVGVSQDDFYKFNNNFVSSISFLGIVLGIISGLLLGMLFNGIFRD